MNHHLFRRFALAGLVLLLMTIQAAAVSAPAATGAPIPEVKPSSTAPAMPRFQEVAYEYRLDVVGPAWGVSWEDYNQDGYPDLFVGVHMHFPSPLYRNWLGMRFEEIGGDLADAIVNMDDHHGAWADFDGDGDSDLMTSAGFYRESRIIENLGNDRFANVSEETGLRDEPNASSRFAVWADFDGNGWADIFEVSNSSADGLFLNRGDGTFEAAAFNGLVANTHYKNSTVFGDLDGDYDIDILSLTRAGPMLLRNRGNGTFIASPDGDGLATGQNPVAAALGDFDNDGDLDLFAPASRLRPGSAALFRNDGKGRFEDITEEIGLVEEILAVDATTPFQTSAFVDMNNDGWLDIFVIRSNAYNRFTSKDYPGAHLLLLNDGQGGFRNATLDANALAPIPAFALGAAFADMDLDGDLDIAIAHGGGDRQVSGPMGLLRNDLEGACTGYVMVHPRRLEGSSDDRSATVVAELDDGRTLYRQAITSQRMFGQDASPIHLGLGCAHEATRIVVTWPDGAVGTARNVPAGDQITIMPGEATPTAEKSALSRAATEMEIDDDAIARFFEENRDAFQPPERIFVDRALLGVFAPRMNPPRLPWEVARAFRESLSTEPDITVLDLAFEHNVKAWSFTDRTVGRVWDIEGEVRGYVERGWLTRERLELRYEPTRAKQIFESSAGRVFGPIREKELNVVDADNRIYNPLLHVLRVTHAAEPAPVVTLEGNRYLEGAIRRALRAQAVQRIVNDKGEGGRNLVFVDGLPILVSKAFAVSAHRRTIAIDEEVSDVQLQDYLALREQELSGPPVFKVRHHGHYVPENLEKSAALIEQGKDLESIEAALKIPSKNTRQGRQSSSYFEEVLLRDSPAEARAYAAVAGASMGELVGPLDIAKDRHENRATFSAEGTVELPNDKDVSWHFYRKDGVVQPGIGDSGMREVARREILRARRLDALERAPVQE